MSMSAQMRPSDCDPKARFRNAKRRPDFTIDQNWSAYSAAEHNRWDRLFKRTQAVLRNRACDEFLSMMEKLELSKSGIPNMEKLSSRLAKLTGWRVVLVWSSYLTRSFSITLPIAAFQREPSFAQKQSWIISKSQTSFTTSSAMSRSWQTPSTPISCKPTVRAANERFLAAD